MNAYALTPQLLIILGAGLALWALYRFIGYRRAQIAAEQSIEEAVLNARQRIAARPVRVDESDEMALMRLELMDAHDRLVSALAREHQLNGYLRDLGANVDAIDACCSHWKHASKALKVTFDARALSQIHDDIDRHCAAKLANSVISTPQGQMPSSPFRELPEHPEWSFAIKLH